MSIALYLCNRMLRREQEETKHVVLLCHVVKDKYSVAIFFSCCVTWCTYVHFVVKVKINLALSERKLTRVPLYCHVVALVIADDQLIVVHP